MGGSRSRYRVVIDMTIGLWKRLTPVCWAYGCVSTLCVPVFVCVCVFSVLRAHTVCTLCLCVFAKFATWVQSDAMSLPAGKGMHACASNGLRVLVSLIEWVSPWVCTCSAVTWVCVTVKQVPLWSSLCDTMAPWRAFCPFPLPLCQSVTASLFSFWRHAPPSSPLPSVPVFPHCLLKWKNMQLICSGKSWHLERL